MSKVEELIAELCPNGVETYPLEQCCKVLDNKRRPIAKAKRERGVYPYCGATGIQDYVSDYIFDGTFILVGEDGTVLTKAGTPVVTWVEGKIWVNNHAHIVEQSDGVLLRYLFHYFQTMDITVLVHGTIPKLTQKDFRAIQIPIPPMPVQEEIVRLMDSLLETVLRLKNVQSQKLTLGRKYIECLRDELLDFREEAEYLPLNDLAKFTYGWIGKAKECGAARFIRITDIDDDGCLKPDGCKYIEWSEDSRKFRVKKGDLLVVRTGTTYGKTLYVPNDEPAVYASYLLKIDLDNDKILNRFYWHFTKSTHYWMQADKLVSSGGQIQFNPKALCKVFVPVPPLEEQERIITILDRLDILNASITQGIMGRLEATEKYYEACRDKLLTFKELNHID